MSIFIGIDPGVGGAVVWYDRDADRLIDVVDMPTVENGPKGRRRISAAILKSYLLRSPIGTAVVEDVGPMPHEGAVGAFSFGRGVGVIEGVLSGLNIPVLWIRPQAWKKRLNFPAGATKDYARGRALDCWPDRGEAFKRKKDDGRAEAALIALAGSQGGF